MPEGRYIPWDRGLLEDLYCNQRLPVSEIAKLVGQKPRTTNAAIHRLGLQRPPGSARNWLFAVDEEFAEAVCSLAWCHNGHGYLVRQFEGSVVTMHNFIWWLKHGNWPRPHEVDHINRLPWDNRLANLRLLSRTGQMLNRNSARERRCPQGVVYMGEAYKTRPYAARIHRGRKAIYVGFYATPEEASEAYQEAKAKLIQQEEQNAKPN